MVVLMVVSFSVAMIMVGWMGVAELAAHQVVINMASFTFMAPLGVAIGASARAGNLIGAGDGPTIRNFERWLRDAGGFSNKAAAGMASACAPYLRGDPDEPREDGVKQLLRALEQAI